MILGCIGDDQTGATDLALALKRGGMRVVLSTSLPHSLDFDPAEVDALVIALKTRTSPVEQAVCDSLAAYRYLERFGATRFYFKYCSTFDSTDKGNIGPVAEELAKAIGVGITIFSPSFPATGRCVFGGNLFVNDVPLAESPMRSHPLTPMRDSDLRRILQRQTDRKVGHLPFDIVDAGVGSIELGLRALAQKGEHFVIADSVSEQHLRDLAYSCRDHRLVTGGSGLAAWLPLAYRQAGMLAIDAAGEEPRDIAAGRQVVLAGSCSAATQRQVAFAIAAGLPALRIDPRAVASGESSVANAVQWALAQPADEPILIYSTTGAEELDEIQRALGRDAAGMLTEDFLATVAEKLVQGGFSRLLVAGGETSGAVARALGSPLLDIGPEVAPGVPWTFTRSPMPLAIVFKSGNFGAESIFVDAWTQLTASGDGRVH